MDRLRVPQDAGSVNGRVQEGHQGFIQRETVYGQGYNTRKFVQENTLLPHGRIDPTNLMSTAYNHNLERVRALNSVPKKAGEPQSAEMPKSENLVSPVHRPALDAEVYSTNMITEHTDGYARRSNPRVYESPFKGEPDPTMHEIYQQKQLEQQASAVPTLVSSRAPTLPRSAKTAIRLPGPEVVARYVEPKVELPTTYQRSYKKVMFHESIPQLSNTIRAGNTRSQSMTGLEQVEKQWKLRDLQDRWSKTQAQRDYHLAHPEPVPYVGDCTIRAKKEILIADTLAKRGMLTVR